MYLKVVLDRVTDIELHMDMHIPLPPPLYWFIQVILQCFRVREVPDWSIENTVISKETILWWFSCWKIIFTYEKAKRSNDLSGVTDGRHRTRPCSMSLISFIINNCIQYTSLLKIIEYTTLVIFNEQNNNTVNKRMWIFVFESVISILLQENKHEFSFMIYHRVCN